MKDCPNCKKEPQFKSFKELQERLPAYKDWTEEEFVRVMGPVENYTHQVLGGGGHFIKE